MKTSRTGILVIVVLAIVAVVLALAGPWLVRKEAGKKVDGAPAQGGKVHARGVVESEESVVIGSQIAGIIKTLKVAEGDRVRRGETLAMLDGGKIRARIEMAESAVSEAEARLSELQSGARSEDREAASNRVAQAEAVHAQALDEFGRQERLYGKNASSLVERNQAEERLKVAAADLGAARANLAKLQKGSRQEEIDQARAKISQMRAEADHYKSYLADHSLISPIDGIVVERIRREGESVDVGTPVLKLINPAKMRVRAELEESEVGKVKEGDSVEVTCDTYPGKVFKGRVQRVFPFVQRREQKTFDPVASFDINTQKIYVTLDDFTGLKDGMSVTVRLRQ